MDFEEQVSAATEEGVVGSQGEAENEANQAEGAAEEADGAAAGTGAEEEARANNARMAAARRTGERQARKAIDAEFEAMGLTDANGREIKTAADAMAYFKAIKKQGYAAEAKKSGKTVEQLEREDDERQRGRKQMAAERSEEERRQFMAADIAEFREAQPGVDINKLLGNATFTRFCGSRLGKEPMTELYDDYVELYGEVEKSSAAARQSKQSRGTGSGSGRSAADGLTSAQQKQLEEWNRQYPNMKMTAKEFLSYGS